MNVECPHCHALLTDLETSATELTCPACTGLFSPPSTEPAETTETDDRLDALRIRKLSASRRSLIRLRTYTVVGTAGLTALSLLLIGKAIVGIRLAHSIQARQLGFLLVALVAAYSAIALARRTLSLTREINTSLLPEPDRPPTFEGLGDGSDRWKNLENIR